MTGLTTFSVSDTQLA